MTPAEELRAAAAKLREHAEQATPGPWRPDADELGRGWDLRSKNYGHMAFGLTQADTAWMALVHPGLAEPLAAWLIDVADDIDADGGIIQSACGEYALAVARVINGSTT